MPNFNVYETPTETARRVLGDAFDPSAPISTAQAQAIFAAEREVAAARRAFDEGTAAPAPQPPPLSDEKIAVARQRAGELRSERTEREALVADARELARSDLGMNEEDFEHTSEEELLRLVGLTDESSETDLATDYAANVEAAESGPASFGEQARQYGEREVAADRANQAQWGDSESA